jgi:hypothetical protein
MQLIVTITVRHQTELPTYMKLVQYEDVREGDRGKTAKSAERLFQRL